MKFEIRTIPHQILEILLIIVIASLAYLPNITKASIYRDDWYYAMDRIIGGPGTFQQMFIIDRPARGPLFEAYFQLFDIQPLPYHLISFMWRVFGGIAALYLFKLLWPGQKRAALYMALLFTLFPGYSRWLEGFENQPRILSSFLEVLSIALTLKAIQMHKTPLKILTWTISILAGWAYIALVDFSIGMEFFRFLCIFLLIKYEMPQLPVVRRTLSSMKSWILAAIIPMGFLFWRLFIFHNQRPTTDIGLQLSILFDAPLHTGLLWLIRLFQSTINITALAWVMPTGQALFNYSIIEIFMAFLFAFAAASFLIVINILLNQTKNFENSDAIETTDKWQIDAIIIGLFGVIVGTLPVIIANRYVTLGNYSHYALPASLAGAVFIGGLISSISTERLRISLISILVIFAILTQFSTSMRITNEETTISKFWQQVVWRAPEIKPGTTLVVNYPGVDYGQDIDTVSGPANYLYFHQETKQIPAIYPIAALEQGETTSKDILANPVKTYTFQYRTHTSFVNYANLLVISQPSDESCVHILNSNWPQLSKTDPVAISLLVPFSKIDRVLPSGKLPVPPTSIFGTEPAHDWCFYYEKAELALQMEDWKTIVNLGNEAIKLDLHPNDSIEWLPFIQAYSYTGNSSILPRLAKSFKQDPEYQKQTCQVLQKMNNNQYSMTPSVMVEIDRLFCQD